MPVNCATACFLSPSFYKELNVKLSSVACQIVCLSYCGCHRSDIKSRQQLAACFSLNAKTRDEYSKMEIHGGPKSKPVCFCQIRIDKIL